MTRLYAAAALLGLLLGPAAVNAASPLESYLSVRDRYIGEIARDAEAHGPESVLEKESRALEELQAKLGSLIGPVTLPGRPVGRINLQTLLDEMGFGMLDGLVYVWPNQDSSLIVTTEPLLRHWLKAHENWWPDSPMPQDAGEALRWDSLYTQALSNDAAVVEYATIPVTAPAQADFAHAMLVNRQQDDGPWTPEEIVVSVIRGGRVFIASQPPVAKIEPIPACESVWQRYQAKSDDLLETYRAGGLKDEKLADEAFKVEAEGSGAYLQCFAKEIGSRADFPALIRQVQDIVDALPAK